MIEQTVATFFTLILEIKLYHWNTKIYSRHIATDTLLKYILVDTTDRLKIIYI